jgi:two-component system, OmpR family, sensor kinase
MREAWSLLDRRGRVALASGATLLAAAAVLLLLVRHEVGEVVLFIGGGLGLAVALIAGHLLDEALARQRRFVSDASHELRTPLTAIRGQVEVLARSQQPEGCEVRRVERVVVEEMGRIERLLDDMLALARLDEEKPLRLEQIDLAPFLRGLADGELNGAVKLGALPQGTLRADRGQLTQVLRNLLANARLHAGPGGRVELSASARGSHLTLHVDDDGPGIAPEERERVFDRFHRSATARDRESGGSGLGLAITRAIVERHGGRIRAEASPPGGARLTVELPHFEPRPGAQLGTA